MIPESICNKMEKQPGEFRRAPEEQGHVLECLRELGIEEHDQWKEFF